MKITFLTVLFTIVSIFTPNNYNYNYEIEGDYTILFETPHLNGMMGDLTGEVYFDPDDPDNSKISLKANVSMIKTGSTFADDKLLGLDWLHAAAFPYVSFNSLEMKRKNEKEFNMKGQLTIKGITKIVDVPIVVKKKEYGKELSGFFTINRMHYNMKADMFGVNVGEDVKIGLFIPLRKKY